MIRVAQLDSITAERDKERGEYDALRKQRLEMFMDGFSQITLKLKEMYQVGPLLQSLQPLAGTSLGCKYAQRTVMGADASAML